MPSVLGVFMVGALLIASKMVLKLWARTHLDKANFEIAILCSNPHSSHVGTWPSRPQVASGQLDGVRTYKISLTLIILAADYVLKLIAFSS